MDAPRFIARRLRFKGKIAMISIAVSFLIMIIAQSVSAGFRKEIRRGVSSISGDVQLTSAMLNYINEDDPISATPSYLSEIEAMKGVDSVTPVVYRVGIIKKEDTIHGVLVKGLPELKDTIDMGVSIPSRLSELLDIGVGDEMLTYFVGEKIKVRKFKVSSIYQSVLETDQNLTVYASIDDIQRLNGWDADQVSALEVTLDDAYRNPVVINEKNAEIGDLALMRAEDSDDVLVSISSVQKYSQLFDWLNLIDFNVIVILMLMTVVAGFNMISGLLILLFQNISTIGTLKALGMTDRAISKVFLRVSSNLILKGMLIGNGIALLFCLLQHTTHMIRLNPANYFVPFVPVAVNVPMILLADLIAYVVIMLLLWIPLKFIAKVDPAQSVRSA